EAERLCDRVGVIANGKLAALGAPVDLRREFQGQRVEIGGYAFRVEWQAELEQLAAIAQAGVRENAIDIRLQNGAAVAPIVRWVVEHGGQIEEVRRGHATLEDVYLQLTASES
ncbi:MAG TPA: DUF4162 domain-containing protein, partial [Longimicrobiales bacterium]|nr:DUF4162 domain-containing protein [Longimicrobiales bacterium]